MSGYDWGMTINELTIGDLFTVFLAKDLMVIIFVVIIYYVGFVWTPRR